MQFFRVNDFITLKLENDITVIYVKDEKFIQCKHLILIINVDDIQRLKNIESIDEAAERISYGAEQYDIPPEVEFWGHCSNLQVWAENEYDTRLLHRSIAFPMLEKLTEKGDIRAKEVLKEEIAKRLSEGNDQVLKFLIEEDFIWYLSKEELLFSVLTAEDAQSILSIENTIKRDLNLVLDLGDETNCFAIKNKKVVKLDLAKNNIKKIPNELGNLTELTELWLSDNYIEKVPEFILNLKKLNMLVLSGNELTQIPDWMTEMSSLEYLYISGNPIIDTVSNHKKFRHLKELEI